MLVIKYQRYGHKGEEIADGIIELPYHDHAILHALIGVFVDRGIRFRFTTAEMEKAHPIES